MANSFRVDRVGMEIKREINEVLQKKVRDPRVQGVTITDVQMLGDLSVAKVYYSIMSDLASDNQKAQTGLEKAKGTIKRELGRKLTLYKIPDLVFEKDQSIEYGNKIDQLLRALETKE
ncbi:ribosome-binding factor A [Streptococcus azizii]|uniref:Ribosome-binding factor A n=1 Tax=Streptococcus azizii TaxID=1579424 RepID=A0AB36JRF7_9STRE|nr:MULTISPECIES: 30S ribosome-binding factor RbfA [Streptococcus]MBF0776409.1 30S ribosome-binding factor RbfA [Streptococcus sp. 19428wD3_AN2]ONK25804.1 ribosome-binding factor A [Streptococcus azizii]ONK30552.1 ribosome-binding factor A [Streptococcus azizii]ONK30969.1 ribosome-binding factor A [Streptococcus azizii]TFU83039.1 30S ribosome-binding factor RbfA [Streptococcus sp. AN2]